MEFGKHIGKGLWGMAGRALPAIYGIGIILFVIRTLPQKEFGIYTLLQTMYLLSTSTAQSFALQPLVKFGAEGDDLAPPVTAAAALYAAFVLPVGALLTLFRQPIGAFFNSTETGDLLPYVSLMLIVSIPRNVAAYLLQSKLNLKTLFFLDAAYSLGSLAAIAVLVPGGIVATAEGITMINLVMLTASSAIGLAVIFRRYRILPVRRPGEIEKFWGYGRYSLGASVAYTLFAQSDNLIISAVLGPLSLAVYNAAKVFTRGFDMALQLMTTLLVPAVAKLHAGGEEREKTALAEKSFMFFTAGLAAVTVFFLVLGSTLLDLIYAGKYGDSTGVLYILALSGILIPAISIGSSYCYAIGKMKEVFAVTLGASALGILLLAVGTAAWGIEGSAWAVVVSYAVMSVAWVAVLRTSAGIPISAAGVWSRRSDPLIFLRRLADDRRTRRRGS